MSLSKKAMRAIFVAILGGYTLSLVGALFLSHAFHLCGILAFALSVTASFFLPDSTPDREQVLPRPWPTVFLVAVVLLPVTAVLSGDLGAPDFGELPILAEREHYRFTRGAEVPRWRFVTVGVSFHLAWHLMLITGTVAHLRSLTADPLRESGTAARAGVLPHRRRLRQ